MNYRPRIEDVGENDLLVSSGNIFKKKKKQDYCVLDTPSGEKNDAEGYASSHLVFLLVAKNLS